MRCFFSLLVNGRTYSYGNLDNYNTWHMFHASMTCYISIWNRALKKDCDIMLRLCLAIVLFSGKWTSSRGPVHAINIVNAIFSEHYGVKQIL